MSTRFCTTCSKYTPVNASDCCAECGYSPPKSNKASINEDAKNRGFDGSKTYMRSDELSIDNVMSNESKGTFQRREKLVDSNKLKVSDILPLSSAPKN